MTHGEKILLVAFILTVTSDADPGWNTAFQTGVALVLGVLFANWHTLWPKQQPPPARSESK